MVLKTNNLIIISAKIKICINIQFLYSVSTINFRIYIINVLYNFIILLYILHHLIIYVKLFIYYIILFVFFPFYFNCTKFKDVKIYFVYTRGVL